ncbi:MAG: DUF4214 domain-containing protein [Ramlibacter sp.]
MFTDSQSVAGETHTGPIATSAVQSGTDNAALLAGTRWSSGSEKTYITYSFADAASQYSSASGSFQSTLSAFSVADQACTRDALASIAKVCNVEFVEVPDAGDSAGAVRFAYSEQPNLMGYAGYAFFPSPSDIGGDVWIGKAQAAPEWDSYRPNLILHETLHAIGLKHPFEGASVLSAQDNIIPNTVMSYSTVAGSQTGSLSRYPGEPMPADVAALQQLYGAATNNAGDTRYDLADATFQTFRALWDSSGIDTLDAGRCEQGVSLDLAMGARSNIGVTIQAFAYQGSGPGHTFTQINYSETLAIVEGCTIENATGSAFDDVLLGNAGDNVLSGGAGDDTLDGEGGNDILLGGDGNDHFHVGAGSGLVAIDGGAGDDTVVFAGQRADYRIGDAHGEVTVSRLADPASVITLAGVERVEFSDAALEARAASAPAFQTEGVSGQALRLYKAALDRLPDASGLAFQAKALQDGQSLSDVAQHFMASPEFNARFGSPQDSEFVNLLYHNVLDRDADAPGMAYYVDKLASHSASRADVLVGFSESPENQATVVGLGQTTALYPV